VSTPRHAHHPKRHEHPVRVVSIPVMVVILPEDSENGRPETIAQRGIDYMLSYADDERVRLEGLIWSSACDKR